MFIVFEGIDGSGKTTVSNKVAAKLRETGLSVEHLREGGKFSSHVTQAIREFGRDARNLDLTPNAEFFLYVTRDVQQIDEMIRPALKKADVVIADRFLYSAEVLSRYGRGLAESTLRPVLESAARGLQPDIVVLIDIDPHIARARRRVAKIITADRKAPSRKGLSGVGMQHRFRAGYRELAAREPQRWVVVDNDQDLNTTVERVFKLILDATRTTPGAAMERLRRDDVTAPHRTPPLVGEPSQALTTFLSLVDRRAEREPDVAAYLLSGLFGPAIDERRQKFAERSPDLIVNGLVGLVDTFSWELRESLVDKIPGRVARSLSGLARIHPRAMGLRKKLTGIVPLDVLSSLDTAETEEAWALREQLFGESAEVVVASLLGIGTARAWEMRETWLRAVEKNLGELTPFERDRILCKSITSLDDDRAWELRKEARAEAPISAIASLWGVTSDKSWKWRERYLERAPKAVMMTMVGSDDARAWDMRDKVVAQCKEALDSITGLDGGRAWHLREQNADIWPSTVVKSLGALASTSAGQKLVERQLRRYPDNISLLKHAAAIAVGANLEPDKSVE